MPTSVSFPIPLAEAELWRNRVLQFGNTFPTFCLLENRGEPGMHSWLKPGEWMVGLDVKKKITGEPGFFSRLESAAHELPLFGFLGYDLKNQVEKLSSARYDRMQAGDAWLFEPVHFIHFDGQALHIHSYHDPAQLHAALQGCTLKEENDKVNIRLKPRMEDATYLEKARQTIEYIKEGEVYELNLCVEYYNDKASIPAISLYKQLVDSARPPFGAFLKMEQRYVLCASPERFLRKTGSQLLSQPIKGTRRRGKTAEEDEILRNDLQHSAKDRAENVMIVDLVRNDLNRSCVPGSVKVDELCGIYSFRHVHQMISTVSGTLKEGVSGIQALQNAFPMGSMTGAPKIRAMQLIEELEESRRGIYSGAIGLFFPNGDFDLNVVIRSVLYNEAKGTLSAFAGGAITVDSDPEAELEEIQVKLKGIRELLGTENFIKIP